jgi:amidohydrolase
MLLIHCVAAGAVEREIQETVKSIYQQIHQHPELSHQEFQTSLLIRGELERAGFTEFVDAPSLETELITVLRTGKPGPVTCLRAELDALGIQEKTEFSFASTVEGSMHACGHDAHAAMLLGAALALKADTTLRGTIVFLWQPAEEHRGGADDIIHDRTLHELGVERVFAQHVTPKIPVGDVQLTAGPLLAGSNYFRVTVSGKSSHGAFPHEGTDVPVALSELVSGLPTLPARRMNVIKEPCIISVGWIECDTQKVYNQIPDECSFGGTVRAFFDIGDTLQNGLTIESMMSGYLTNLAAAYGCSANFRMSRGAPPTVNDKSLAAKLLPEIQTGWEYGEVSQGDRYMTAEDFAYYTQEFPSLYFRLGIAKEGLGEVGLHQSEFTIHPDALEVGTQLLIWLAHYE